MFKELFVFYKNKVLWKSLVKDGELYASLFIAILSYFLFQEFPSLMCCINAHFADILTVISIIFGFALSALLFYIQSFSNWSDKKDVRAVASKIIDWHIWTLLCLLTLLLYVCALWALSSSVIMTCLNSTRLNMLLVTKFLYSLFIFQIFYSGLQILNHILTIWWSFNKRDRLEKGKGDTIMTPIMATMASITRKEKNGLVVWYSIYRLVYSDDDTCKLIDQGNEYQFIIYFKEGEAPYILIGNPILEGSTHKVFHSMMDALTGIEDHYSNNY